MDEYITPFMKKLDWLRIEQRKAYFTAVILYRIVCMKKPSYLVALFSKNQGKIPKKNGVSELLIPQSRTDAVLDSFQAQGSRLCNSLQI